MDMESYEDFCLRSLARLQTESQGKSQGQQTGCEPPGLVEALSFIHFHGRAVLSPLTVNGYTLVTDSPGLPRGGGVVGLHIADRPTTPQPESPIVLNVYRAEERVNQVEEGRWEVERGEEEMGGVQDVSLQSLLRRSREYVEREQAQRGTKVIGGVTPTTPAAESLSDKENESRSPQGEMKPEQGYSLRHSPLSPPQTQAHIPHQSQYPVQAQAQYQAMCNPYDSRFSYLSSGLPDAYALLPSPEPSMSPRPHRRRPRPVSTGNIMISFPIGPADLIPRGLVGRHQESAVVMATGVMRSPDQGSGVSDGSSSHRSSQCGTSQVQEKSCSSVSTSGPGSLGHHDVISSGSRRRCHTLDSQLHSSHSASGPGMDRSQERLPRFMGGVPHLPPSRRSPAVPLNQSYEVENPSAALLRPHELDEKEKRLREQGCGRPLCGDDGRDRRSVSDIYPGLSPSCPGLSPTLSPADRSPRHSVVTIEQQRALCHLGAISRGFLTRRLLQTEKVKQLRQTIQDTQEFIRSFQTEAPQKRGSISAQDLSLQERVRAQLRAAQYDVHDIFFEMPLEERLALLQLDREVRTEKKLREMEKARSPKDRVLSAATQRSLDRKKRVGESPGQARKVQQKPKSPPTNRILKPSQGQNASVPGQLNRQGSWYRKTPEDRVRRSDSLKKQNSLG
ncbi:unnamed protein product [Coregonus sp. 'balchen']|nr:unnamed protein product [Coregonus sp. 'balchen']